MRAQIVFSDVDGTLVDGSQRISENNLYAIRSLQEQGVPFVIVSARSPSGIYSLHRRFGFSGPIVAYSGALIADEDGSIIDSKGYSRETAKNVIAFLEENRFDCAWNLFSQDTWLVKDRSDPRIVVEEREVGAQSREGSADMLPQDAVINKILLICHPSCVAQIQQALTDTFPELNVVESSNCLLEVMAKGVSKGTAVRTLCDRWHISLESAAAFGDFYNDVEMLEAVGMPRVMKNAPKELQKRFGCVTSHANYEDGIYHALAEMGMIPENKAE